VPLSYPTLEAIKKLTQPHQSAIRGGATSASVLPHLWKRNDVAMTTSSDEEEGGNVILWRKITATVVVVVLLAVVLSYYITARTPILELVLLLKEEV
jgi:hypothetical protein